LPTIDRQGRIAQLKSDLSNLYRSANTTEADAHRCEKLADELEREENLARLEAKDKAGPQKNQLTRRLPQSPWLRAIWDAVISLGEGLHYREYANYIAENATCKLPKYLAGHDDVGLAVRNKKIGEQFQKDLNKVKAKVRSAP
jgi:hypothetical protein